MNKEETEKKLKEIINYMNNKEKIYNKNPLKSMEDARRYLEEIKTGLMMLHDKSLEVGLTSHAAMFIGIYAAFTSSNDSVERMINVIKMQAELELIMIMEKERKGE